MSPGTRSLGVGVAVVLDPLHEGTGTVADSRDGDLDLAGRLLHGSLLSVVVLLGTAARLANRRAHDLRRAFECSDLVLGCLGRRGTTWAACSAAMRRSIQLRSCSVASLAWSTSERW